MKLKLQYLGCLMRIAWLIREDPDAGKDWRQKGTTEDEMVGWHHRLDGHEFEQTPGDSKGQGSLACCSPWGRKKSDTTEQLNRTELYPWHYLSTLSLFTHLILTTTFWAYPHSIDGKAEEKRGYWVHSGRKWWIQIHAFWLISHDLKRALLSLQRLSLASSGGEREI